MSAELTLAMANVLHTQGDHRLAFMYAVRASREVFAAVGTDPSMEPPLKHLFDSLDDIDRGVIDPALKQKVDNRRGEPSHEWNARACLAAAVDARMMTGELEAVATEAIRRTTTIISGNKTAERTVSTKRLADWRKQFRSQTPPPAGLVIYQTAEKIIEDRSKNDTGASRVAALLGFEQRLIAWATEFRARLPKGA